jgi:mitochondrial chaperone BCS1
MFPGSFDPSSLVLLFLGKDNTWIPFIAIIFVIFQKWNAIQNFYKSALLFGKTQYKVTGTFYTNIEESHSYGDLSSSAWALIRFINNLVKEDKTLLSNATNIKFPYNNVFEDDDVVAIPTSNAVLKLNDDINCSIELIHQNRESTKSDKVCMIDSTTITFTLTTKKAFETIMKFMNTVTKEHTKIVKSKHTRTKYIIKPLYSKRMCDMDTTELSYPEMIEFKTSKSFDNLFFDGKEELIKRLDSFVNRDKYKALGLPETLGILFHGQPGTGKTSCIKAIAQYLDMSLIIVPMNQIKTKKRLEELFFSERIRTPQEKRIYVFEEIDCNGWENIVRERSLIKEEVEEESNEKALVETITNAIQARKNKIQKDKDEDKLTLGGILEIIDGLVECPGRVIIMTTNHKEHLDSALLRPGRIDIEIEFKKLRYPHIAQIYKKWYGKKMEDFYAEDIPDYKYSQAEISQLLFKYENDSNGFIREVTA